MTRTAGAPIGCQRPSRFWGLGCPKIYHEAEDTLDIALDPWAVLHGAGHIGRERPLVSCPALGALLDLGVYVGD
ncbi:hypothetical protein, partial [Thiolapillus sp.]|uniref:hypothetical protein n=1 Tax=Thiolapillus sp. TaxID=2017437 RepID=UPI003AF703F7